MRKILVGVDLSRESELAVHHAVDLGRRRDAEVVLALAVQLPAPPDGAMGFDGTAPAGDLASTLATPAPGSAVSAYVRMLGQHLAAERHALAAMRERWLGKGVNVTHVIAEGYPDEQLPQLALQLATEFVVVGTHGRTGVKRVALGSVAERVVRWTQCSVLVARGDGPGDGYRHIVIGTDFSPESERAIERACELAAPKARIDVVHCWTVQPWMTAPDVSTPILVDVGPDLLRHVKDEGARLLARWRAKCGHELAFHVVERPVAHGIDEFARDHRAELVVVGSHGRRGLRRFVLGSVAENTVRHAPCAVLVAR
jgi:nucleotide-binding universal stress UspA family protein